MGLLIVIIYLLFALDTAQAQEKTIYLNVNGLATSYHTSCQTVKTLIEEVYPNDNEIISVFPELNKAIFSGDTVFVQIKPRQVNKTVAFNLETAIKEAIEPEPPLNETTAETTIEPEVIITEPEPEPNLEPKSPTYAGTASWYRYGDKLTTASTQFPRGTKIRVMAVNSDKVVDVVVNDYGPESWTGVCLDLNSIAFAKLAPLGAGKIHIKYFVI